MTPEEFGTWLTHHTKAYPGLAAWLEKNEGQISLWQQMLAGAELEDALAALAELEPVRFNYRTELDETYVGFIAEDVPDLVATNDRASLSTMDIVAVLTKVIQAQQEKIDELEKRIDD